LKNICESDLSTIQLLKIYSGCQTAVAKEELKSTNSNPSEQLTAEEANVLQPIENFAVATMEEKYRHLNERISALGENYPLQVASAYVEGVKPIDIFWIYVLSAETRSDLTTLVKGAPKQRIAKLVLVHQMYQVLGKGSAYRGLDTGPDIKKICASQLPTIELIKRFLTCK
jgi:hypothetical protein